MVVETTALTNAYRGRTAVDGLDLALPAGVVAGFVGPNGGGTSTTLRMLLGPFEHIVQNAWADAGRWFPGLLREALAAGGTSVTTVERSLLVGGAVVAAAAYDLHRRDVLA